MIDLNDVEPTLARPMAPTPTTRVGARARLIAIDSAIAAIRRVGSRMWWKLPGSVLRACEVARGQAARSRAIGSMG